MKRALLIGIALAAFTTFAAEQGVGIGKKFKGPIGLQLYSLRAILSCG